MRGASARCQGRRSGFITRLPEVPGLTRYTPSWPLPEIRFRAAAFVPPRVLLVVAARDQHADVGVAAGLSAGRIGADLIANDEVGRSAVDPDPTAAEAVDDQAGDHAVVRGQLDANAQRAGRGAVESDEGRAGIARLSPGVERHRVRDGR